MVKLQSKARTNIMRKSFIKTRFTSNNFLADILASRNACHLLNKIRFTSAKTSEPSFALSRFPAYQKPATGFAAVFRDDVVFERKNIATRDANCRRSSSHLFIGCTTIQTSSYRSPGQNNTPRSFFNWPSPPQAWGLPSTHQ